MSSAGAEFLQAARTWLRTTSEARPKVPSEVEVGERVLGLQQRARTQPGGSAGVLTEGDLAALSRLVADLEAKACTPAQTLEEIEEIYTFLSLSPWPAGTAGERSEVLSHLAYLGWRVARRLGLAKKSQHWSHQHDLVFADGSPERECVEYFLGTLPAERSAGFDRAFLSDSRRVFAVCAILREWLNVRTADVAAQASAAYRLIDTSISRLGEADDKEWFLAELALLAGSSERGLGHRINTNLWLDRFGKLVGRLDGAAPLVARADYVRLCLQYDHCNWVWVLGQIPGAIRAFEALEMRAEVSKTLFVEAIALKNCLRDQESMDKFEHLRARLADESDAGLLGQVLGELGPFYAARGQVERAICTFREALSLLLSSRRMLGVANLNLLVGESLRFGGRSNEAIEAFRKAIGLFSSLGMETWAAYSRLILADTLLSLGRPVEAEEEITRALPTIEEEGMLAEGFAAVSLLRESVCRRRSDSDAFRKLRDRVHRLE